MNLRSWIFFENGRCEREDNSTVSRFFFFQILAKDRDDRDNLERFEF